MMLKVIDWNYDKKIDAFSIIATMSIENYLELTKDSEENFELQRKIISTKKNKVYERLVEDLKIGCTIPPIVLVVRNNYEKIAEELKGADPQLGVISNYLSDINNEQVSILDGLQRTNCIRKAKAELQDGNAEIYTAFKKREIRVEFWIDIEFQAMLYRMITLNAGQTPMSLKHQLEILNIHLLQAIKNVREDLEIYTTKENGRRNNAKQYQFALLVEGYNAFISRSPVTDAKNEVIEELTRISFLDTYVNHGKKVDVSKYINTIVEIDEAICQKYNEVPDSEGDSIQFGHQFFGKNPYFIGVCAALGRASYQFSEEQFNERIKQLIELILADKHDPIGFSMLNDLIKAIPNKSKVGEIQRELITEVFEQYLMLGRDFETAWMYAGARVKSR
ncbi:hypothetical protein [Rossellomorea marisflavi]|uniref:hypothetical protein n=1 Tax=Rossellomorea marisflavi TaxID=189381 RepID=UPI001BC8B242|nr:hypothetical protein [Rossellomorea marisflavi]